MFYDTQERKPSKLLLIEFDRITLNSLGGYERTDQDMNRAMYNFVEFGFATAADIAMRDTPPTLPMPPVIPHTSEKEALYKYLKEKIKPLSVDAPYIMEMRISSLKQIHKEYIDLVKQAMKIMYSSGKTY